LHYFCRKAFDSASGIAKMRPTSTGSLKAQLKGC
jgi:hypothetical protein